MNEKVSDPRVKDVRGFYIAVFKKLYGFTPAISYPISGAIIKRWLKDFSEWQCYIFILIHFQWRGMDGTDDYIHKRLKDKAFPIEWITSNINAYQAYARNVMNIDFDNEVILKKYVNDYLQSIK